MWGLLCCVCVDQVTFFNPVIERVPRLQRQKKVFSKQQGDGAEPVQKYKHSPLFILVSETSPQASWWKWSGEGKKQTQGKQNFFYLFSAPPSGK